MDHKSPLVVIVTNADDATSDYLIQHLDGQRIAHCRLNTDALDDYAIRLTAEFGILPAFEVNTNDRWISADEISTLYFRRPYRPHLHRILDPDERRWAQSEYLNAWGGFLATVPPSRWMNHPCNNLRASYKPEQLLRARAAGFRVPPSLITRDPAEARAFLGRYPSAIVKPVGHGEVTSATGTTEHLVYTNEVPATVDDELIKLVAAAPTLFQERVPKAHDLRVTVVDDRVHAVAIHSQDRSDTAVDCRRDLLHVRYSDAALPSADAQAIRELVRGYGLRFAAIDMCVDQVGQAWFFEINPVGQWAWLDQIARTTIAQSILDSFMQDAGK